jgi:hypothetical protein
MEFPTKVEAIERLVGKKYYPPIGIHTPADACTCSAPGFERGWAVLIFQIVCMYICRSMSTVCTPLSLHVLYMYAAAPQRVLLIGEGSACYKVVSKFVTTLRVDRVRVGIGDSRLFWHIQRSTFADHAYRRPSTLNAVRCMAVWQLQQFTTTSEVP